MCVASLSVVQPLDCWSDPMAGAEPTLWGSGASRRRQSVPDDLHISQSCPGDSEQPLQHALQQAAAAQTVFCCCECSFFGKPAAPDRIRHTPLVAAYFFDGSVEAVSALANGTAGSHLSQMMRPSVSGLMGAVAVTWPAVCCAYWRDEELDWSLTGSRERGCGEREGRGAAW